MLQHMNEQDIWILWGDTRDLVDEVNARARSGTSNRCLEVTQLVALDDH